MLAQPVLARFIEDGHFAAHVRRMRRLYADRQEALLSAAKAHLSGLLKIDADEAGMHLIASPASGSMGAMDDRSIAQAAAKAGVMVMALSTAYAGKPVRRGLILGYAAHDEDAIAAAARRLGEIMAAAA